MLHLLDGFLAPFLGEVPVAPVVQHPVVNPVLVDCGELAAQPFVELFNDSGIALHGPAPDRGNFEETSRRGSLDRLKAICAPRTSSISPRRVRGAENFQAEWRRGQPLQAAAAPVNASSMMRLMVRAQRPHWALRPRQP